MMSSSPLPSESNLGPSAPGLSPDLSEDPSQSSALALLGVLRDALNAGDHSPEEILTAAVNAARVLTGASGSAIGLRTHSSVVCRARSGDVAPELGAALNVESGISGACFRSSAIMQCDDAQTDERVDPEVCRLLGINSIVAMPLRADAETIGILEVFSNRAFAFSAEDISFLKELSQIAEIAYRREWEIKNPKPAPTFWTRPPAPPNTSPNTSEDPILSRAAILPPAVREQNEREQRELLREKLNVSPSIAPPAPATNRRYWIMSVAVTLILMASAVVWWTWREPDGESAQTVAEAHTTPAGTVAPSSVPIEFPAKPSPRISGIELDRSSANSVLKNAAKTEAAENENGETPGALDSANPASSTGPTSAFGPRTTVAASEPPPTVVAAADSGDKLAGLVSTAAPMPSLEVRVSQGVTQANLVHKVEPVYPREALLTRLSGTVTLNASIAENGTVTEVKIVKGHPVLAQAAVAAVRQWRYGPSLLNGKPIAVQKDVTIVFKLP